MSTTSHELRFRFIRKADFSTITGALDDVIALKRVDNNLFSLNYIHRYKGEVQRTYVVVKEADAITWLTSLLSLLGVDKDPFYRIQIDLPCFPSILLNAETMSTRLYDIVEAVRFSMANYPLPPQVIHQAIDEADQGEEKEEEEEEEDYSDMPGLVPAEDYSEMPPLTPIRSYNFVPAYEGRHLFLDHEEATSAVSQAGGTPA